MYRLTVATETPAYLATSRIVVEEDFRVMSNEPLEFPDNDLSYFDQCQQVICRIL
jgi:hypothetical protein